MKKLMTIFLALGISLYSFAQAIDDEAVIPVSITLNSILRLNVTSGGNIEFVFNNLNQYTLGIATNARYNTDFNVSSSIDFDVDLTPENTSFFIGTDDPGHQMGIEYVRINVIEAVAGPSDVFGGPTAFIPAQANYEIVSYDGSNSNAGTGLVNSFTIQWDVMPIIAADLAADRYSNNFFLSLRTNN